MATFSFHTCRGKKLACIDCNKPICNTCKVKSGATINCKTCAAEKGGDFAQHEKLKLQRASVGAGVAGLGMLGMFASCST